MYTLIKKEINMTTNNDDNIEISRKDFNKLLLELDTFEHNFMSLLTNEEEYEIIALPKGRIDSEIADQLNSIIKNCKEQNIPIIYQVSLKDSDIYLCPGNTYKIGLVPKNGATEAFIC